MTTDATIAVDQIKTEMRWQMEQAMFGPASERAMHEYVIERLEVVAGCIRIMTDNGERHALDDVAAEMGVEV